MLQALRTAQPHDPRQPGSELEDEEGAVHHGDLVQGEPQELEQRQHREADQRPAQGRRQHPGKDTEPRGQRQGTQHEPEAPHEPGLQERRHHQGDQEGRRPGMAERVGGRVGALRVAAVPPGPGPREEPTQEEEDEALGDDPVAAVARVADELGPDVRQIDTDLARQGEDRLGGRDRAPHGLVLAHQQSRGELLLRGLDALKGRTQRAPRLADPVLEREGRREVVPHLLLGGRQLGEGLLDLAHDRSGSPGAARFRERPPPELRLVRDLRDPLVEGVGLLLDPALESRERVAQLLPARRLAPSSAGLWRLLQQGLDALGGRVHLLLEHLELRPDPIQRLRRALRLDLFQPGGQRLRLRADLADGNERGRGARRTRIPAGGLLGHRPSREAQREERSESCQAKPAPGHVASARARFGVIFTMVLFLPVLDPRRAHSILCPQF